MKEAAQVGHGWNAPLPWLLAMAMLLVSGCARPAAKEEAKPVTWEYKTMEVKRTSHTYGELVLPETEIRDWGKQGWELVSAPEIDPEKTKSVTLIFKREAGKYPKDETRWNPDSRSSEKSGF